MAASNCHLLLGTLSVTLSHVFTFDIYPAFPLHLTFISGYFVAAMIRVTTFLEFLET